MTIRYEIEEGTNAIRVFYPDSDVASLFQPTWPDQTPWADANEAESWAQLYIASVEDEEAPYAPNTRGEAGRAKLTAAQRDALQTARKNVEDASTSEERETAQQALNNLIKSFN